MIRIPHWATDDFQYGGGNPTAKLFRVLDLAAYLDLDRPVRDVPGCTFFSATELLSVPGQQAVRAGTFEVEGDDYDPATGLSRVLIVQPGACAPVTELVECRQ